MFLAALSTIVVVYVVRAQVHRIIWRLDRAERPQLMIAERLIAIDDMTKKILDTLTSAGVASVAQFYVIIDGHKRRIQDMKAMKIDQKLPFGVDFLDKNQNPAKVDGPPKWGVSDESLAKLEIAEDGMSGVLTPTGVAGTLQLLVFADADLDPGKEVEIKGVSEDIVISGLDAVEVAIKLGDPV